MSLPWNKAVRVRVGRHSVQGVLHPAWAPRLPLAQTRQHIDTSLDSALSAVLATLSVGARVRTGEVFMADARVHFDVVAGEYADLSERQLESIAQVCVAEILGDSASRQRIRWQLQPGLKHLLIAAMDASEVDQVLQAGASAGLRAISLQPDFCRHWNAHRAALPGGNGVIASVSDGHVVTALVSHGAITALSCGSIQLQPGTLASPSDRPASEGRALDERANRLLASVGQDPGEVDAWVLLLQQGETIEADARWRVTVVDEALS